MPRAQERLCPFTALATSRAARLPYPKTWAVVRKLRPLNRLMDTSETVGSLRQSSSGLPISILHATGKCDDVVHTLVAHPSTEPMLPQAHTYPQDPQGSHVTPRFSIHGQVKVITVSTDTHLLQSAIIVGNGSIKQAMQSLCQSRYQKRQFMKAIESNDHGIFECFASFFAFVVDPISSEEVAHAVGSLRHASFVGICET
jgi:hypothetical protein